MPKNTATNKAEIRHNFWQDLPKPFFVLAPMANVTDSVFRKLIAKYGKPDVMWTEFVSADGLMSAGREKLLHDLKFSGAERPIVAQLFTGHPEAMRGAAKLASGLGFDGLDINMGCPDRAVEKQGGGAAAIKNPKMAIEVLQAAREGFGEPVTIKTRLGYNKVDLDWIRILLEQKMSALTIHLRTRKEMSDVPAHWELMTEIIKLRNEISPETLIIGNGDVVSLDDAAEKCKKYGCDGVMIGRGIFGTPWIFENLKRVSEHSFFPNLKSDEKFVTFGKSQKGTSTSSIDAIPKTPEERLTILLEHAKLFEKVFRQNGREIKSFDVMKKHFKAYISGWDGAKELRMKLMEMKNSKEVREVVGDYLHGLATDKLDGQG